MTALNTLGMDDDLDTVGFVIAVERAFDIKISDHEASAVRTLGDLHDLVTSKLDGAGGDKCRTSLAFYRVRRCLRAVVGDADICPDTALRAIWQGSPKTLFARAQAHSELRLEGLSSTGIGGCGAMLILAAAASPALLIVKLNGWLVLSLAIGLAAVGYALLRLDPLSFEPKMVTVGDLARRTATQNYGALVRMGGRSDSQSVWDSLVEIAASESENLPAEKIQRSTLILQSQFDDERARLKT